MGGRMSFKKIRDCSGEKLPKGRLVKSHGNDNLEYFCEQLDVGEEILLYESVGRKLYYWLYMSDDEGTPIVVCCLEKYADSAKLQGRRADYFCMGWYKGECYIVIIELRKELTEISQLTDKTDQVEQSVSLIIGFLQKCHSDFFFHACEKPSQYKIIGIVIPATYSKQRAIQSKNIEINGKKYLIASIPNDRIKECRITWKTLFEAIGL